jgi:hypothetical protein
VLPLLHFSLRAITVSPNAGRLGLRFLWAIPPMPVALGQFVGARKLAAIAALPRGHERRLRRCARRTGDIWELSRTWRSRFSDEMRSGVIHQYIRHRPQSEKVSPLIRRAEHIAGHDSDGGLPCPYAAIRSERRLWESRKTRQRARRILRRFSASPKPGSNGLGYRFQLFSKVLSTSAVSPR